MFFFFCDVCCLFGQNQRQQAEKQIREEFAEIRKFLENQELVRIALLAEEEEEKLHLMKKNTDNLSRDILTFSHAVRTIDNEIANVDSVFLQVWGVLHFFVFLFFLAKMFLFRI